MIDVIFYTIPVEKQDVSETLGNIRKIYGYELKGHAGYADHGEDIVCASISVLSLHTANAFTELTDNKVSVEMNDDGYLKVMVEEKMDEYGELLMKSFVMSVHNIHNDYSNDLNENEFINIKFEEV